METTLSKKDKELLIAAYKSYVEKRKTDPTSNARCLGGSETIKRELLPDWSIEDVENSCRSLSRNGLFKCLYADNIVYIASINDYGIVYAENIPKNKVKEILSAFGKLGEIISILIK